MTLQSPGLQFAFVRVTTIMTYSCHFINLVAMTTIITHSDLDTPTVSNSYFVTLTVYTEIIVKFIYLQSKSTKC